MTNTVKCKSCGMIADLTHNADEWVSDIPCPDCGKVSLKKHVSLGGIVLAFPEPTHERYGIPKHGTRREMYSVATVDSAKIEKLKREVPGVEIDDRPFVNGKANEKFGVPVVQNLQQKRRVLKSMGFKERESPKDRRLV